MSTKQAIAISYVKNYVDGSWVDAENSETTLVIDPSDGAQITKVPSAKRSDVDRAVGAAKRSAGQWASTTPGERAEMLLALADNVEREADTFVKLESANTGKPISTVNGEVQTAVDRLRFCAGATRSLEGRAAGEYVHGYTSMTRRDPLGVAALISPWNYPLIMAATKLGPALATGNTVVLKPSEQTPLTSLHLAGLAQDIFPRGVLNVITGEGHSAGAALAQHPKVDVVSLTGDTDTGKAVARAAADSLKRVQLELGGKAPAIVLDDADLDHVTSVLKSSSFWNAGQDCSASARVIVTRSVADSLLDKLVEAVKSIRMGDPSDPLTEMGPLVHDDHQRRVLGLLDRAKASGAKFLTGGQAVNSPGFFIEPTIITNVDQDSEIIQKEVFGPVITVQTVDDAQAAHQLANDVPYGLAASIFTQNVNHAMEASQQLQFGTVWVNDHSVMASDMPWGGFKESGYGNERSIYSLEEFTELKHVMIRNGNPS